MNGKAKKILIIDDDPDFVRSTGLVLKTAGYEVLEAFSGKEGLEKSNSGKPDLYIIDLMMETYSEGSAITNALREDEESRNKPMIMITSVDLRGPWDTYQQEWIGCDIVMQKPVSSEELLRTVAEALSGRKPPRD